MMPENTEAVREYSDEEISRLVAMLNAEMIETREMIQQSSQLAALCKTATHEVIDGEAWGEFFRDYPMLEEEGWDEYEERVRANYASQGIQIVAPTITISANYWDLISQYKLVYNENCQICRIAEDGAVVVVEDMSPRELEDAIQGLRLLRVS